MTSKHLLSSCKTPFIASNVVQRSLCYVPRIIHSCNKTPTFSTCTSRWRFAISGPAQEKNVVCCSLHAKSRTIHTNSTQHDSHIHRVLHSNVKIHIDQPLLCRQCTLSSHSMSLRHFPTHFTSIAQYSGLNSPNTLHSSSCISRKLHTGRKLYKEEPKSKVEQTVIALKEKAEKAEKTVKEAAPISTEAVHAESLAPVKAVSPAAEIPKTPKPAATPPAVVKKSIPQRVIAELKHYYNGFKLLFTDVRVGVQLLWQVLNGSSLNRRERRQLVRTTSDLFRLVPFSVFIIIPFMEFLLPVAIKLFPNMLPSTFQTENKAQEKFRKSLKMKLEMAKFLQDTIEETGIEMKGDRSRATEFHEFINKIRTSGEITSNEEILKYSKLFEDEITLDTLGRQQLIALCKLVESPTIGTNNFLRFQLRMKLRQLEADDMLIKKEGIDTLTVWELQDACRARGMRALGVPQSRLKSQLNQWLDLHLNEKVPAALLLLSRTLYLSDSIPAEEKLKTTISVLPDSTAEEAKLKLVEVSGERVDNKAKLERIKQEEEAIKAEKAEDAEAEKAKVAKKPVVEPEPEVVPTAAAEQPAPQAEKIPIEEPIPTPAPMSEILTDKPDVTLEDKATVIEPKPEEVIAEKEEEITVDDLGTMKVIFKEHAKIQSEKEELKILKEDVEDYQENLDSLKEVIISSGGSEKDLRESKAAQRLSKRVNKMISQLSGVLEGLHTEKEALLEDIEVKEVRVKRSRDGEAKEEFLQEIDEKKKNLISVNELMLSVRRLQKVPDDTKLQRIAQVLDEDKDGKIDIDDALEVIELLGKENVKLSAQHITEILTILHKEDVVEEITKQDTGNETSSKSEPQPPSSRKF